ncbi:hypothetical protein ACRJ4W_47940 [Streptomyces sp. GLT-R25]
MTIRTGTKTYVRLVGSSSQRNRSPAGRASFSRSRASTSSCRRSASRIRSSIRASRPSSTIPSSITSTTSSNTPHRMARCHCHRYR